MNDCEPVADTLPIRQGDVIKRVVLEGKQPLFVVMTADCDIANVRFGDAGLACVELVSLYHYYLSDHAVCHSRRQIDRRYLKLSEWINRRRLQLDASCSDISVDRIRSWACEASIEEVERVLEITPESKPSFVRREIEVLKAADAALRDASRFAGIDAARALQPKEISRADQAKALLSQFDPLALPLDVFFVSSVPGERGVGFLAKLRALSFVPFEKSFTSMAEAKENNPAYVRVGRLGPTFRHGIAQQFGMLFARIGYPGSYESDRATAFSVVADEISNELEKLDATSHCD